MEQSFRRFKNWWWYHWKYVLLIGIAAAIVLGILLDRREERRPDCSMALVTRRMLPAEELTALQTALERVAGDYNGDGEVHVAVNAIRIDYTAQNVNGEALKVLEANIDKLNFDFYTCQSGLLLLDDPEHFQQAQAALSY